MARSTSDKSTTDETTTTDSNTLENGEGLAGTGNPNDLAQPQGRDTTDAGVAHQDGAPEELAKVADEAEEKGYLGVGAPEKPDYSQANPTVMNQGDKG